MDIYAYWDAVLGQRADDMRRFFREGAVVNWPNTNESFTVEEFIRANCEYPGNWAGEIERVERLGELIITAVRVFPRGGGASFHSVSFIRLDGDMISSVDEYWGDDGQPPEWRRALSLGRELVPAGEDPERGG